MTAEKSLSILVTDRNHHVRDFICRELQAAGCKVYQAPNYTEFLRITTASEPIDIVVMDPDLPGDKKEEALKTIRALYPRILIIVHYCGNGSELQPYGFDTLTYIEKEGGSVDRIIDIVRDLSRAG